MLQKQLGSEYSSEAERKRFLNDNCDRVEEINYLRRFTEDEVQQKKDELANVSIKMNDLEEEKKQAVAEFADALKPLKAQRTKVLTDLRNKAENVDEQCYAFFDHEGKRVGYYNREGELVSTRAMRPQEFQKSIFTDVQRGGELTGTND